MLVAFALLAGLAVQEPPVEFPTLDRLRKHVRGDGSTDDALGRVLDAARADLESLIQREATPARISLGTFDPWCRPPRLHLDFEIEGERAAGATTSFRLETSADLPDTLARSDPRPEWSTPLESMPPIEVQLRDAEALTVDLLLRDRQLLVVERYEPGRAVVWTALAGTPEARRELWLHSRVELDGEGMTWDFSGRHVPHRVFAPLWRRALAIAGDEELGALLIESGEDATWRGVVVVVKSDFWHARAARLVELELGIEGHLVEHPPAPLQDLLILDRGTYRRWSARLADGRELEIRATQGASLFCADPDVDVLERPPARLAGRELALAAGRAVYPPGLFGR